jgi:hypothetical protein
MAKRATGLSRSNSSSGNNQPGGQIFAARVSQIILDDRTLPEAFESLGNWSSIGTIFFSLIQTPNSNPDPTANPTAKPLFPNTKHYPLINEIVYIMSLPNSNNEGSPNSTSFYYFSPLSIWGSNHHNATPNPFSNTLPDSQKQDYKQTEAGAVRRVTDGGTEIDLGSTFVEKLNIKTLLPYEGDIIHEGRWGQSFRYGSTVNDAIIPNTWSSSGENGDPILIIKNGQHDDGNDPWVPQVEDINKDKSSIYFTSTQKININPSSKNYKGYKNPPIAPSEFVGEQIILNSGRLLLNSKYDSILLSSAKSINLNSLEDVVVESPTTTIQSSKIYLGDKSASEPIILGDKFLTDMSKLLTQLIALGTALQTPIGTPVPLVPNAAIPVPAVNLTMQANQMLNSIETYKSKVSKSK